MTKSDATCVAPGSAIEESPHPAEHPARTHAAAEPPLVVDLDGTLVRTDLLIEAYLALVKRSLLEALRLPLWLVRGRAAFKREVARRVTLEVQSLPYRDELCRYLRSEADRGRRLILASANDEIIAAEVARHLGIFERVIASDGVVNMKGASKRDRLVRELGERGFDYAGDCRSDLAVWSSARTAIVVGGDRRLRDAAAERTAVHDFTEPRRGAAQAALRALRPQQWLKNTLVVLPVLAANRAGELALLGSSLKAFGAFCLVASALYVFNDLLDLDADRRHPDKRTRPIAAGDLALAHALVLWPLLLTGGFLLAASLPGGFLPFLALYSVLALAYSLRLKHVVLLDVIVLTSLYMIRVLAGAAATEIPLPRWLLAFAMLAFLSLAVLKRYTEIVNLGAVSGGRARARGYGTSDTALLMMIGAAGGIGATVVLAMEPTPPHSDPEYVRGWVFCGAYLYWISHLWLTAGRGRMAFDPIVFAFKDRRSLALIAVMAVLIVLAQ